MMTDRITRLRLDRGDQQVTFAEIADHLFDYGERFPEHREAVEGIAGFFVAVEAIPHDHDADAQRGVPADMVVGLLTEQVP
jgi:hypothetical protein